MINIVFKARYFRGPNISRGFYTNRENFIHKNFSTLATVVSVTAVTSQFAKILSAKDKTETIREMFGP